MDLHIDRGQLWLWLLFQRYSRHVPTGGSPREDLVHGRGTMSLSWAGSTLGIPLAELEKAPVQGEIWYSLLNSGVHIARLWISDGWMDRWMVQNLVVKVDENSRGGSHQEHLQESFISV